MVVSVYLLRSSYIRALGAPIGLVDKWEQHLCEIIESSQSSPEDKYQALLELAYMTGIMDRETTDTSEDEPKVTVDASINPV